MSETNARGMIEQLTEYVKNMHLEFWKRQGRDKVPSYGVMNHRHADELFAPYVRYDPDTGRRYVYIQGVRIHLTDFIPYEDGCYFIELPEPELSIDWKPDESSFRPMMTFGVGYRSTWIDPTID